jgi:hypothetical protein
MATGRIGTCQPSRDTCGLKRASFPCCPIERFAPIVPGGEIDENDLLPASDLSRDDVAHEELPIVLVCDHYDIYG